MNLKETIFKTSRDLALAVIAGADKTVRYVPEAWALLMVKVARPLRKADVLKKGDAGKDPGNMFISAVFLW